MNYLGLIFYFIIAILTLDVTPPRDNRCNIPKRFFEQTGEARGASTEILLKSNQEDYKQGRRGKNKNSNNS